MPFVFVFTLCVECWMLYIWSAYLVRNKREMKTAFMWNITCCILLFTAIIIISRHTHTIECHTIFSLEKSSWDAFAFIFWYTHSIPLLRWHIFVDITNRHFLFFLHVCAYVCVCIICLTDWVYFWCIKTWVILPMFKWNCDVMREIQFKYFQSTNR